MVLSAALPHLLHFVLHTDLIIFASLMWCAEGGCSNYTVNYADSMPARLFSNLGITNFKQVHFLEW